MARLFKKELAALLLAVMLVNLLAAGSAKAISATTAFIQLYVDQKSAFVGKEEVPLDAPATILNGSTYVPAKFLGDAMGFKVEWNDATRTIAMEPPGYKITLDSDHQKVTINGVDTTFEPYAAIVNGKLLVKLTWVADYMGAKYTWDGDLRRVQIVFVKKPEGLFVDAYSNKPVAKFTTGKAEYRLGEPVKYVDLSYDPDAEGIASYDWKGNQEAFFEPGTYAVTLQVTDSKGNKSAPYTGYVKVNDTPYLSQTEYPFYMKPVGSIIPSNWATYYNRYRNFPDLPKKVTASTDRTLLVSDSPETIMQQGILYQDEVNGKARLYADHVNGTDTPLQMTIFATNNTTKPVTIKTTNRGEVYPSVYAQLIGNEASVDFLMGNPIDDHTIVVPPKQTYVYSQMPTMYPTQGVNLFYDIETDGPVDITFAAAERLTSDSVYTLPRQSYIGNVRGTFQTADLRWDVDTSALTQPSKLVLGDGVTDVFVNGVDKLRNQPVNNYGNYGVKYDIHIEKPRKMAILIVGVGGGFCGPFKINGDFVRVPQSGVLTAFDGLQVLARTTGTEPSLDIEYTPPAGTGFPADLIFYPLEDKQ